MSAGLPDLVDCALLAEQSAVLERVYALRELQRIKETLAVPEGTLSAKFAFAKWGPGRSGVTLTFEAAPVLVCQRCLQGFPSELSGGSEVEFTSGDDGESTDSEREFFRMREGLVSLRELAEEELLLALPLAPACSTPLTCGKAPDPHAANERGKRVVEMRRPFSALQDLLKKT